MWPPSGGYFLHMKAKIYLKDVANQYGGQEEMGQHIVAEYGCLNKETLSLSFKGRRWEWGGHRKYYVDKVNCIIFRFNEYYDSILQKH